MAISLTHTTAADATFSTDGADAWNEAHTLTMATARMLGRTTASAGAVEEISVGSGLTLSAGTLDLTVPMDLAGGTVTTSNPVIDMTQTWNAGAQTFTGVKLNVTDTASASGSLLMDLQVGGSSKFTINKAGIVSLKRTLGGDSDVDLQFAGHASTGFTGYSSAILLCSVNGTRLMDMRVPDGVSFTNGQLMIGAVGGSQVYLRSAAAANLQLGAADAAAPVAQTLSVQSVVAGTSNTAGTDFSIYGSKSTGTGAGGSIKFYTSPAGSTGTAQNAGVLALTIDSTGKATFAASIDVTTTLSLANQTFVASDAANTLALRNGTNAQQFNLYETYTDASNYSRFGFGYYSSWYYVGTVAAGTGSLRGFTFAINGNMAWNIDTNKVLYPGGTLATNMTTGFINIPGAAGAPSGTPATTTGFPLYWDSTNLKLYVYTGGAWKASAAFT